VRGLREIHRDTATARGGERERERERGWRRRCERERRRFISGGD
jgi:hypothetical protein